MSAEVLLRRCHELADLPVAERLGPESLIGFFQQFRPDGTALEGLFQEFEAGPELHARLRQLYAVAGDDRRPGGGRDAYFVVRQPKPIAPQQAERLATAWLEGLLAIATHLHDWAMLQSLKQAPRIRVLEGHAPKHPKQPSEQAALLRAIRGAANLVEQIDAGSLAETLRPAYYFTACDAMLRDYLMWPLYAQATGLEDPLRPYFELWEHGVKYRIFDDSQVDLYLPRHPH